METNLKLKAFEYTLEQLGEWYKEVTKTSDFPVFSKLKAFKLLFFVSSVNAEDNELGLLDIFDNHHALPYGPVESDIYDSLSAMSNFEVKGYDICKKAVGIHQDLTPDIKNSISAAVNLLRKKNNKLVELNPFDLVEISHKWYSWQFTFDLAKKLNQRSKKIPNQLIARDFKIYSL